MRQVFSRNKFLRLVGDWIIYCECHRISFYDGEIWKVIGGNMLWNNSHTRNSSFYLNSGKVLNELLSCTYKSMFLTLCDKIVALTSYLVLVAQLIDRNNNIHKISRKKIEFARSIFQEWIHFKMESKFVPRNFSPSGISENHQQVSIITIC